MYFKRNSFGIEPYFDFDERDSFTDWLCTYVIRISCIKQVNYVSGVNLCKCNLHYTAYVYLSQG